MNLYLIEQSSGGGYDTFDQAVVKAESSEEASKMYPGNSAGKFTKYNIDYHGSSWTMDTSKVKVTLLGKCTPSLNTDIVICASFNAG